MVLLSKKEKKIKEIISKAFSCVVCECNITYIEMKMSYFNLNNKGRLDGDICFVFICLCVWLSGLDLRNGLTYEYEICTANSCDDILKSEV